MATETEKAEVSEAQNDSSNHESFSVQLSDKRESRKSNFGRMLAHRALFGSSSRREGSRNGRTSDVRMLPSRLSKVSLADDAEN